MISASVNVVVHSMFCHNHMRNVWVKNLLDSLTEFLRAHLNGSLDEVAPELCFSPGFMSLACDFEIVLVSVKTISRVLERYFVNG